MEREVYGEKGRNIEEKYKKRIDDKKKCQRDETKWNQQVLDKEEEGDR